MANLQEDFICKKRIKTLHLWCISGQRNAAHFDQCNESIDGLVLKSADKSDEEIIKII
jgi:hypothetical protein